MHIGGAMSRLHGDIGNKWIHEICRIWCTTPINRAIPFSPSPSTHLPQSPFQSDSGLLKEPENKLEDTQRSQVTQICCICGMDDNSLNKSNRIQQNKGLIKCAAIGCHVMFHPMCAVLVTKLSKESSSSIMVGGDSADISKSPSSSNVTKSIHQRAKEAIQQDIEHCQEYTLELLEVKYSKRRSNNSNNQGTDTLFMVRGGSINNGMSNHEKDEKETEQRIIPIGLCGLHNPKRNKTFYGCTPGAMTMSEFIKIPYQT